MKRALARTLFVLALGPGIEPGIAAPFACSAQLALPPECSPDALAQILNVAGVTHAGLLNARTHQARYYSILEAACLLVDERRGFFPDLYERFVATAKYAPSASWRTRVWDWASARRYRTPFYRDRSLAVRDALAASGEKTAPDIVDAFAAEFVALPEPAFFAGRARVLDMLKRSNAEAIRVHGTVGASAEWPQGSRRISDRLYDHTSEIYFEHGYLPWDDETLQLWLDSYAAKNLSAKPESALLLKYSMMHAHRAMLPIPFEGFKTVLRRRFLGVLQRATRLLERDWKRTLPPDRATPHSPGVYDSFMPRPVAVQGRGGVSRYRQRKNALAAEADVDSSAAETESLTFDYELLFSDAAKKARTDLTEDAGLKRLVQQLDKTLEKLSNNPFHPGLNSHPQHERSSLHGHTVFTSYVQQGKGSAYRVLWRYHERFRTLEILEIVPHY